MSKPFILIVLLTVMLTTGCSLPKIVILNDPLTPEEHLRLGGIYETRNELDQAREQYRAAARADRTNARAWTLLGDLSFRMNDLKEAETAYEKALRLDPENGDLSNNLAWVFVRQDKRIGKAHDLVTSALALKPAHRPYYLDTLGVILLRQGKVSEALAALQESATTVPPERTGLLAEVYEHLAEAHTAAGNTNGAAEALRARDTLMNRH